jgi:hypothetical protein
MTSPAPAIDSMNLTPGVLVGPCVWCSVLRAGMMYSPWLCFVLSFQVVLTRGAVRRGRGRRLASATLTVGWRRLGQRLAVAVDGYDKLVAVRVEGAG